VAFMSRFVGVVFLKSVLFSFKSENCSNVCVILLGLKCDFLRCRLSTKMKILYSAFLFVRGHWLVAFFFFVFFF